jgi:ABC-type amino acid transport substrate-binding protein
MRGIDVDIAKALAARLGLGLSTMNLTASDESMEDDLRNAVWKGHYMGGGVADVMMHVPVDDRFAEANDQVIIFGPYFQERLAIAHDKERIPEIRDLLIFAREKVGVELATFPDIYLSSAQSGQLRHNVVHYRTVEDACQALKAGEVPAMMAHQAQLEHCVNGKEGAYTIAQVPAPGRGPFTWAVGMAVKADNTELRDALRRALEEIRADGTLEAMFARQGLSYVAPVAGEPIARVDRPGGDSD